MKRALVVVTLLTAAMAWAQKAPPAPPAPPGPPGPMMGPPGPHLRGMGPGIPAPIAQKLGIPAETVKKVRDLSFEANEALIGLEADLKRAQLDLEKAMSQANIDEGTVMVKLEAITRAELAVRKNRIGLMLRIRKTVGPDTWEKLQAEMPMGPGAGMGHGPGMGMGMGREMRREVRIIREGDD